VPLFMFEFNQNDRKIDTGVKLVKLGLAASMPPSASFRGVILSSETKTCIARDDVSLIHNPASLMTKNGSQRNGGRPGFKAAKSSKHHSKGGRGGPPTGAAGLAGINCSWNRLDECRISHLGHLRNHRTLPFLLAANGTNYGKPLKLSTAEAIAVSLYLCGFDRQAKFLLTKYKWGPHFWTLNESALKYYSEASTSAEMREQEKKFLDFCAAERGLRRASLETGNQNRSGPSASGSISNVPDSKALCSPSTQTPSDEDDSEAES